MTHRIGLRFAKTLARFRAQERGVALIEFAFALPVLTLLFVGSFQLSDALSAYRKVTTATRTIADLTSQSATVTADDLDMILNASQQVMSPYKPDLAAMTVSQIKIDGGGNATVAWSRGKNTTRLEPGSAFSIPTAIKQNNTSMIVAQIVYSYTPIMASTMIGVIPMKDQIFMNPRRNDTITCTGCS